MPGPTERSSRSAAGTSPQREGRSTTSHSAWVPVSISATARSCGNAAAPRPDPGRPNARALAGGIGHLERGAIQRHQAQSTQEGAQRFGHGDRPATAWNRSRNSRALARCRARTMAALVGSC
jgi:hypothetical protein